MARPMRALRPDYVFSGGRTLSGVSLLVQDDDVRPRRRLSDALDDAVLDQQRDAGERAPAGENVVRSQGSHRSRHVASSREKGHMVREWIRL